MKTLILMGFAGNTCVLFTANDAYMRNFELIIPKDCIGSNTKEVRWDFFVDLSDILLNSKEKDACLQKMEKILKADIRPSTDIIKEIQKPAKNKESSGQKSSRIIRR